MFLLNSCGERECSVQVLAFYYTWYGTPHFSGEWIHWDDAGHNPDVFDENGLRDISSPRHPYPEVYDSSSEEVIERHVNEGEYAGIHGFISSWWGRGDMTDLNSLKVLDVLEKRNSNLKLALYYELAPQNSGEKVMEDIEYIKSNYMMRSGYLKENGKPVLFIYFRALFKALECLGENYCMPHERDFLNWIPVIEKHGDVFYVADGMSYAIAPLLSPYFKNMGMNGIHIYNPVVDILAGMNMKKRYTHFIMEARKYGLEPYLTIIPGYDDTRLQRPHPLYLSRYDGELYELLWDYIEDSGARKILITTFNEWHEGTEIEPSVELRDKYLKITKERIEKLCKR